MGLFTFVSDIHQIFIKRIPVIKKNQQNTQTASAHTVSENCFATLSRPFENGVPGGCAWTPTKELHLFP